MKSDEELARELLDAVKASGAWEPDDVYVDGKDIKDVIVDGRVNFIKLSTHLRSIFQTK